MTQYNDPATAGLPLTEAYHLADRLRSILGQAIGPSRVSDGMQTDDSSACVGCEGNPATAQEQHPDDAAVDAFAAAMKAKLAKKRSEGRGGWQIMSAKELTQQLRQHVEKGDPLDVANLAMMLHQNGQRIESLKEPLGGELLYLWAKFSEEADLNYLQASSLIKYTREAIRHYGYPVQTAPKECVKVPVSLIAKIQKYGDERADGSDRSHETLKKLMTELRVLLSQSA